jgi:hypothetical protein
MNESGLMNFTIRNGETSLLFDTEEEARKWYFKLKDINSASVTKDKDGRGYWVNYVQKITPEEAERFGYEHYE